MSMNLLAAETEYTRLTALLTTFKKFVFRVAATALASSVLPVPGGPYSSTPLGGLIPTRYKDPGTV